MNNAHEQLLENWANLPHHGGSGFIYDGIIDPTKWVMAARKVLFINKEAHDGKDPDSEGFDLRVVIRDHWKGEPPNNNKTYQIVAQWAYAVHHAPVAPPTTFPRYDLISKKDQIESLLSSAVINIKKSNGKSISDTEDLKSYVDEDGERLREQIYLINPDIIICGGIWHLIQHLWDKPEKIYDDVFEADGRVIFAFWHPANRYPAQMNYYALAAFLQNSKALKRYK